MQQNLFLVTLKGLSVSFGGYLGAPWGGVALRVPFSGGLKMTIF